MLKGPIIGHLKVEIERQEAMIDLLVAALDSLMVHYDISSKLLDQVTTELGRAAGVGG